MKTIFLVLIVLIGIAGFMTSHYIECGQITVCPNFQDKIKQIEDFARNEQAYGWEIDLNATCCHDYAWVATLTIYNPIWNEDGDVEQGKDDEYLGWSDTPEKAVDNLILKIDNDLKIGDK